MTVRNNIADEARDFAQWRLEQLGKGVIRPTRRMYYQHLIEQKQKEKDVLSNVVKQTTKKKKEKHDYGIK